MISKDLLDILACPRCKQAVRLTPDADGLVCDRCSLVYPIHAEDGVSIPVMLEDEARPAGDQDDQPAH